MIFDAPYLSSCFALLMMNMTRMIKINLGVLGRVVHIKSFQKGHVGSAHQSQCMMTTMVSSALAAGFTIRIKQGNQFGIPGQRVQSFHDSHVA
jgi:hypothetical protein